MDLFEKFNAIRSYISVILLTLLLPGCVGSGVTGVPRQNDALKVVSSDEKKKNPDFSDLFAKELSIDKLRDIALKNNRELQSIYFRWQAARERAPQQAALPDPKVSYDYFIEPIQTKTGPQDQKIGISQTIPWFGKLSLKEKIALKQAEAVYQEYKTARRRISAELEKSYYEYSWLYEGIAINREHLDLLKVVESVATVRFKAGKISQSTLVQIQVEQGRLEDRIKELEDLKFPISAKVCSLAGFESELILPAPGKLAAGEGLASASELKQQLIEFNPQLERLRLLKEGGDLSVRLAGKNYYPDFTFGLSFIDIDGGDDPAVAHVSFNLPIWWDSLGAARREAVDRREGVDKELQDRLNRLFAELELDLYHYRNAERKRSLYENSLIPKARQSIDLAIKGFEAGSVNFADLMDAERTLLEFKLESERYLTNAYQSKADINALAGRTREMMK